MTIPDLNNALVGKRFLIKSRYYMFVTHSEVKIANAEGFFLIDAKYYLRPKDNTISLKIVHPEFGIEYKFVRGFVLLDTPLQDAILL